MLSMDATSDKAGGMMQPGSTTDTHNFRVPINSRCQGLADNDGGGTRPSDLCYAVKPSSVKPSPDSRGFST